MDEQPEQRDVMDDITHEGEHDKKKNVRGTASTTTQTLIMTPSTMMMR